MEAATTLVDNLQVLTTHLSALPWGVSRPIVHLKDDAKIRNVLISVLRYADFLTFFNFSEMIFSTLQNDFRKLC